MRVFAVLGYGTAEEAVRCFLVRAESVGETVLLVREPGLADGLAELIPYPSSILGSANGPPGVLRYGPVPHGIARPK